MQNFLVANTHSVSVSHWLVWHCQLCFTYAWH